MALTKSEKTTTLEQLASALKGVDSAILFDYKGLNVPQVTELRRQVRAAKGQYQVVKNTLARRALKGTEFEPLSEFFQGTTAIAFTGTDPVALAKTLTTFAKTAPQLTIKAAVVQGRKIQAGRGDGTGAASGQARAVREAAVPPQRADGPARHRPQRGAAGAVERADAGGEEEGRIIDLGGSEDLSYTRRATGPAARRADLWSANAAFMSEEN